jgi:hypothetical protein
LEATEQYRSHSDIQGEFIDSECQRGDDLSVKLDFLYGKHKDWSLKVKESLLTLQEFKEMLQSQGFKISRREHETGRPEYIHGLGLIEVKRM